MISPLSVILPGEPQSGPRPVIVHGLAGSAAVALLVVPGMMRLASAMATPLGYAQRRPGLSERRLAVSCGIASICTGVFPGIQTLA